MRDEPLVLPSEQTLPGLSAQMRAAFREAGITPRVAAHADELSGMMACPIAGLAAAVVPEQIAVMRQSAAARAR